MQPTNYFNLDIKTRAGESLVQEGVHYKIFKDGNGVEYKVVNFENLEICPREGIVQLHPLVVSKRHGNSVGFKVVTDKITGIIYGIPTGVNPKTKELEFLKIRLVDMETLDLALPMDAMKWTVIRNSFFVEGSPNLNGKPKYKVYDAERQASLYLSGRAVKRKAVDIAEYLTGSNLVDMARNLGIPPENNSVPTMHMEVIKRAEDDPKKFMDIWESPTRKELTVLKAALATGVVSFDPAIGFNYNGSPLGPNESMAVEYLKEYPQQCQTIDLLSKQQESASVKAMTKTDVKPIVDSKDARIAALEVALANKESLLKDVSGAKITEDGDKYMKYLAEGRRLGIKNIHAVKNLDKIIAKVEEANPEFRLDSVSDL